MHIAHQELVVIAKEFVWFYSGVVVLLMKLV